MAVDEVESNSDIQSKKRKKLKRGSSKKKSADTHHDDTPEEMPSVPASPKKKRKFKKLKLTEDSVSESVEVVHQTNEPSSKSISDRNERTSIDVNAAEEGNSKLSPTQEDDSLENQSKKKNKKKKNKAQANSVPQSSNCDSASNTTKSEKSKKKKRKKKKSKQKNKSTNSPTEKNVPSNSSTASSRSKKAILYLETWKNDRNEWKFEKLTQNWLLKNMFDENMVPEAAFETLLEYFVCLQGNSKNFVIQLCEDIFKKMAASEEGDQVLERAYKRARSITQCLQ